MRWRGGAAKRQTERTAHAPAGAIPAPVSAAVASLGAAPPDQDSADEADPAAPSRLKVSSGHTGRRKSSLSNHFSP
jgi:hypothetical protein